jgi:hypothetical protein
MLFPQLLKLALSFLKSFLANWDRIYDLLLDTLRAIETFLTPSFIRNIVEFA